ncbi:heme anaerobic degradation radical SAM methyltransferase ChuW/HutW [Rhodobacter capsulatus]|uniref:Heme anaerobic degradation radical SAM methyltransferase ChuW/HutW n=1 Tax=Rhodobacter capsulatus TaxID=1061 RepID=A0A4U1JRM5_RHOCA|nr:heme anaerobic degradation radical SAM methyltransferase ChuW/HutW [Rhodobacter capsulatus]TKD21674.1 heme anaerobic degradation radical SAM methyltransferase ChuW/HutW [Rhodobacter capsulatus]
MRDALISQAPAVAEPAPVAQYFATLGPDPLACAFPRKGGAHPGAAMQPVPPEQVETEWQSLLGRPRHRRAVAYVHIPFCENHCLFCGFYQNPWRADAAGSYVDALIAQMAAFARTPAHDGPPLQAVYLGGGTPTALSAADIVRLVRAIRRHLPLTPDCEITLEGRIHSFGADKARAALDAGVTRISLGVQSFADAIRKPLGRKAGRQEIVAALSDLVALDRGAVIVDLIYGLPGQTPEAVAADVRLCGEIGLDGLDLYALTLIPGTPLLTALGKGKTQVAGPDRLGHFFAAGEAAAAEIGWTPISTSHWQGSLRERSVYNLAVKAGADCLAFGAGAGGGLGDLSFRLTPDLARYARQAGAGVGLVAGMMRQAPSAPVAHAIKAGMERGLLDLARAEAAFAALVPRPKRGLSEHFAPLLAQWRTAGLWAPHHRFHRLTLAGRFWQVPMTTRLLGWMAEHPDLSHS